MASLVIAFGPTAERRRVRNEAAAVRTLLTISSVQGQWVEGDRCDLPPAVYMSSLAEMSTAGLVDPILGSGTRNGYRYSLAASGLVWWECRATPVSSRTGDRNFYISTDGVVRFAEKGEEADRNSAPIK